MASYQARQRISSLNSHHQSINGTYSGRPTRVFTQLDNITPPESKSFYCENPNKEEKVDRIAQIKKKYENLLNKHPGNIENDFQGSRRSQMIDQKWNKISAQKPFVAANERSHSAIPLRPSVSANKSYQASDYSISNKGDLKSQLNDSRNTLSAMKSELQSKLNELNSRTTMNSVIKKPIEEPSYLRETSSHKQREERSYMYPSQNYSKNAQLSIDESQAYEQIAKKYSKYSKYDNSDYKKPYVGTSKDKSSNHKNDKTGYLEKYMKKEGNHHKQQLSVISQKSNSNIEQSFKDNTQIEERSANLENVDTSLVRQIIDPRRDELFKRNSYMDDKQIKERIDRSFTKQTDVSNIQQDYEPMKKGSIYQQFSLSKEFIERRYQQKKEAITSQCINARSHTNKKDESSRYSGPQFQNDIKEATFGKQAKKPYIASYEERPRTTSSYEPKDYEQYKRERSISSQPIQQENIPQDELKTTNWKYEYKDNEELSEKISKIDQKIRQIEGKKKNLDIDFKPYENKSPYKQRNPEEKKESRYDHLSRVTRQIKTSLRENDPQPVRSKIVSYLDKVRPLYSEKTISEADRSKASDFSIKLIPAWKQES